MKRYFTTVIATVAAIFCAAAVPATAQDTKAYGALLKKYVRSGGVDYRAWSANAQDKVALDRVLQEWSRVNAGALESKDRAAFRINLYNAAMIDVVLDRYPLKSVTRIGIPFSIFKKRIISTPQGKISLDTLEKQQLLGDMPDPRIHFAVNCASISCPPLAAEPYTGRQLDAQLNAATKNFAVSSEAVRVKGSTAYYSELFKWYRDDFGTDDPAEFLNRYRSRSLPGGLKVKYLDYNWGLNEA